MLELTKLLQSEEVDLLVQKENRKTSWQRPREGSTSKELSDSVHETRAPTQKGWHQPWLHRRQPGTDVTQRGEGTQHLSLDQMKPTEATPQAGEHAATCTVDCDKTWEYVGPQLTPSPSLASREQARVPEAQRLWSSAVTRHSPRGSTKSQTVATKPTTLASIPQGCSISGTPGYRREPSPQIKTSP